jgi:hypothetical protein
MRLFSSVALLLMGAAFAGSASADWIEQSNVNAMMVLQSQAKFEPESVARVGLSQFDADVIDLNPDYNERQSASDRLLLAELNKRLALKQDPRVREDLEILIQALQDGIETRRIDSAYLLPYYPLDRLLFQSFNILLDPRNDKARYTSALKRLRKYNGSIEGYTPITELAMARSTERFGVKGLLGPYRPELDADLADAPRYIAGIRDLFQQAGLAGWEDDLALLGNPAGRVPGVAARGYVASRPAG